MKKIFIGIVLVIIFLASSTVSAFLLASIQGTIKGIVVNKKDKSPIEGVKITIASMQYAAVKFALKSNKKGEFIQIGLQPDFYQIKAEKDGFFPVFLEKKVGISDVVDVTLEMEEGKYFVAESPGDKDFKRGNELFQAGNYQEAAQAYQEAINKEPGEPIYYNNLGISHTKLGKYEEAIQVFKKMLEIQPESVSANKSLGQIYGLQKNFAEALPYFTKGAELSPNDPDAFYDLGACLMNTQDFAKALEAFSRVKEIKPDYAKAYYQLGMIYVNQNKKAEAIQNLEKFLELAPNDPDASIAKQVLEYLKSSGNN